MIGIDAIRDAERCLAGEVLRTPTVPADGLAARTGARLSLKLESLQPTGSFKVRGAGVKLAGLSDAERAKGVVAASAGNHAQGVAFHARRLGVPATIVMPRETPFTKVGRTEALGARVVLTGDDVGDAEAHALDLAAAEGATFVHPFDDEDVIRGQGTVALEMLADAPDLECLVVPVGGGGLIAGMAVAARALKPEIEIVGVECDLYPSMRRALDGDPAPKAGGATAAEGIAVKHPGARTLPMVEDLVDDVATVDEAAIERAIHAFVDVQRLVVEGAGAAPLALVESRPERFAGRRVGLVVSGGNIDSRLLASIMMRGLVREGRLVSLRIGLADSPGALARVSGIIGAAGGNIVEVTHRRLFHDVPVKRTDIDVVIETQGRDHVGRLIQALDEAGFPSRLLGTTAVANGG